MVSDVLRLLPVLLRPLLAVVAVSSSSRRVLPDTAMTPFNLVGQFPSVPCAMHDVVHLQDGMSSVCRKGRQIIRVSATDSGRHGCVTG